MLCIYIFIREEQLVHNGMVLVAVTYFFLEPDLPERDYCCHELGITISKPCYKCLAMGELVFKELLQKLCPSMSGLRDVDVRLLM